MMTITKKEIDERVGRLNELCAGFRVQLNQASRAAEVLVIEIENSGDDELMQSHTRGVLEALANISMPWSIPLLSDENKVAPLKVVDSK